MADLVSAQNNNFEGAKMEKVKDAVEKKLDGIQKDNTEKLEAMRQTVDEKLHATLEKRLGESFKIVSDRLELVHKGLGEMQTLAIGVGDLKKVLTNVKTRGTFGEMQLSNLLEQILTPEQYDKDIATKKGSRDRVEFAIKLPGKDDNKTVFLPIDAKFPQKDYQRLVEAYEQSNLEMIEEAGKNLEIRIKGEAKKIQEKYIDPPNTTDFGIMFLPYESLYAEVLRRPGLCELIQRTYRVTITGPTTLYALLNARFLDAHVNTIHADLRAFDYQSLNSVRQSPLSGAPTRIDAVQRAEILRLADSAPYELGLPYGRWSVEKLRQYLLKHRVVKAISHEHLRRLLKKGDSTFAESGAKSSAMTPKGRRFWAESV
jgi:hypothetical protein